MQVRFDKLFRAGKHEEKVQGDKDTSGKVQIPGEKNEGLLHLVGGLNTSTPRCDNGEIDFFPGKFSEVPSRKVTYPTMGKGKASSKLTVVFVFYFGGVSPWKLKRKSP